VYITENNPKFFASIQKRVDNYLKSRDIQPEPARVFDFFMAGIVQLLIAFVAFKAGLIGKIRSVKSFAS